MTQVSIRQARDNLSQLIRDAQAGQDVVITNHGTPVARIAPVRARTGRDVLAWLAANPAPAGGGRSAVQIDAAIEGERDSWE